MKNAIAYAKICGICANICEFLDMQHNFRTCDFRNLLYAEKYAICEFWQNARSHIRI